jgi:hypothetical protein
VPAEIRKLEAVFESFEKTCKRVLSRWAFFCIGQSVEHEIRFLPQNLCKPYQTFDNFSRDRDTCLCLWQLNLCAKRHHKYITFVRGHFIAGFVVDL